MENEKTVIDWFLSSIDSASSALKESLKGKDELTTKIALIDSFFSEKVQEDPTLLEGGAFEQLKNKSFTEIKAFIESFAPTTNPEFVNLVGAAHFVLNSKTGIKIRESQLEALRELRDLANLKKASLNREYAEKEKDSTTLSSLDELKISLTSLTDHGVLDRSIIEKFFQLLQVEEKDKGAYLDAVLKYNYDQYQQLRKSKNVPSIMEKSVVKSQEQLTFEQLEGLFYQYGYDFSKLDSKYIELLLNETSSLQIEEIFQALDENKITCFKELENERYADLYGKRITNILLGSSKEIIYEVARRFEQSGVSKELLKGYVPILIEKVHERIPVTNKHTMKETKPMDSSSTNDELKIYGKHTDFAANLDLLEGLGFDKKTLLERNSTVLMLRHETLLKNVATLSLYEFPFAAKKVALTSLLVAEPTELIDRFIELGEEAYVLNNSSILWKVTNGTFERLYFLKHEGYPYSRELKGQKVLKLYVTRTDRPCIVKIGKDREIEIPDSKIYESVPKDVEEFLAHNPMSQLLDEYVPIKISRETLEDPIIKNLDEKYQATSLTYNLEGVVVSRKKLLRNYEFLRNHLQDNDDIENILMVSAIHNSILTKMEIDNVRKSLSKCYGEKGGNNGVLKK